MATRPAPDFVQRRDGPHNSSRTWPRGEVREYDVRFEVLVPCARCKRKVGGGPLKALRLWRVRQVNSRQRDGDSWNLAYIVCADQAECDAYRASKRAKARAASERRRPPMPFKDVGAGHCKWCGEAIELVPEASPQRRQRAYHRGDEWETTDRDCVTEMRSWLDPRAATQELLKRQRGCCTICGMLIARQVERANYKEVQRNGQRDYVRDGTVLVWEQIPPREGGTAGWAVDHVLPLADGGDNRLENLQVICQRPCHVEKTAQEATERARRRREARAKA